MLACRLANRFAIYFILSIIDGKHKRPNMDLLHGSADSAQILPSAASAAVAIASAASAVAAAAMGCNGSRTQRATALQHTEPLAMSATKKDKRGQRRGQ